MPQYSEFTPTNVPGGQHSDRQEYHIRDASVSVDLTKLANDLEMGQRELSRQLGFDKYLPVDGPTGCTLTYRLPGRHAVSLACTIDTIMPLTTPEHEATEAVWLRGQMSNQTLFAPVIEANQPHPRVLQRVIVATGPEAALTNEAVQDYFAAA